MVFIRESAYSSASRKWHITSITDQFSSPPRADCACSCVTLRNKACSTSGVARSASINSWDELYTAISGFALFAQLVLFGLLRAFHTRNLAARYPVARPDKSQHRLF